MKQYKVYKIEEEEEVSKVSDLDMAATYSYANYLKWTFEDRLELIKGRIFPMSPAPGRIHQKTSQAINRQLLNYLSGKTCEVYTAPFDVRLPRKNKSDKSIQTVVQPDLCVVCDSSKLDDRGCIGAPDIVVEILSPGNNKKELRYKYEVYEESGVKEYWIVWPQEKTFMRYVLEESGKFKPTRLQTLDDEVTTPVLPGLVLKLNEVFKD